MIDEQMALPLTEATFLILLSLAPAPQHGYGIMQDIGRLSDGRIAFSTGTLYGALKRLLDQGWIERSDADETSAAGARPRKNYRLTETGYRILRAETARIERLAQVARLRFQGGGA